MRSEIRGLVVVLALCCTALAADAQKRGKVDPVAVKAAFVSALEIGNIVGEGSAAEAYEKLAADPERGELGARLAAAAGAAAEEIQRRALARESLDAETLQRGRALFALAARLEPEGQRHVAGGAFLEGWAALQGGAFAQAIERFDAAIAAAPGVADYRFFRAMALWRSGDRAGALARLQAELPGDRRTLVLATAMAIAEAPEGGAAAVESTLFSVGFSGE